MPKGTPLGDVTNGKICPECKEHKALEHFYVSRQTPSGRGVYCKPCVNEKYEKGRQRDPEAAARRGREWRAKNPERARDLLLRHHYGVEIGTYAKMLAEQNGACAICGITDPGMPRFTRFHLDHCHDSKKVRGLLCHNCNVGLGHFFNSPDLLHKAVTYLAERG